MHGRHSQGINCALTGSFRVTIGGVVSEGLEDGGSERAESVLRDLGFRVCRVRHHDTLARLEIGRDELPRALQPDVRDAIIRELRAIGYRHVTVDLQGYRMGSLNDGVRLRPV